MLSPPMAHFLIIFDCRTMTLLRCDEYAEADFESAARDRLEAELKHRLDPKMEIVVLSGPSREVIEMTHGELLQDRGADRTGDVARDQPSPT